MLELVSTRAETSGKLASKCGKSLDTQMLSAPPNSSTVAPTSRSPLSIAEKQLRCPVFEGRHLEVGRIGVVVLAQIPLDAAQQPRHPPALRLQEGNPQARIELEDAAEHQRDQCQLHFGRMARRQAH